MGVSESLRGAFFRALGFYPTRVMGLKFKRDPYHVQFWRKVSRGRWKPDTYEVLSKFLNRNSVYYDIGAWIGPTVIFAANRCKRVVCFEPDPVAFQYLLWNINLNELHNVLPINAALADRNALMRMASFDKRLGDSMTSLLKTCSTEGATDVMALTWKEWIGICNGEPPDFLKIDIEGGEFALLPTLKEYLSAHKPIVYLSTHAPFLTAKERIGQMAKIIEAMEGYDLCLREDLEPVAVSDLVDEEALKNFRSYVFLDRSAHGAFQPTVVRSTAQGG
jgi:FkbM family methyltransferase